MRGGLWIGLAVGYGLLGAVAIVFGEVGDQGGGYGVLVVVVVPLPLEHRIEAHIFIAFLAYCLHVTLAQHLRPHASGLTPRAVLEKFAAVQMVDVEIPTTDARTLVLTRYTEPSPELKLLLERLPFELPEQPPPKITAAQADANPSP